MRKMLFTCHTKQGSADAFFGKMLFSIGQDARVLFVDHQRQTAQHSTNGILTHNPKSPN
ncbi:hypothetical protein CANARDRAFT_30631 [[Candida] arabinofermentans NRRL YB-2248]|uniref:Uncharacterized protein n=1 Tax=[Candida] arabinofermentans NRRL YB-2248 TaxID=983967 RepID=A0A1E4ST82_9ASCO|nr:hypothetical protein CANARDRAFT_30631 [[Candida] arabinofermentans NRRL YB-2248]